MNAQQRLSELDATKLANLRLRQQLLTVEAQVFEKKLFADYGNEGETFSVDVDNSITRIPDPVVAPTKRERRYPSRR